MDSAAINAIAQAVTGRQKAEETGEQPQPPSEDLFDTAQYQVHFSIYNTLHGNSHVFTVDFTCNCFVEDQKISKLIKPFREDRKGKEVS